MLVGGREPYPPAPLEVLGLSKLERLPDEWALFPPFEKPQLDWSECEYPELGEGSSISRALPADAPLEYGAKLAEDGGSSAGVSG